jgi:hypothetical protein
MSDMSDSNMHRSPSENQFASEDPATENAIHDQRQAGQNNSPRSKHSHHPSIIFMV